MKGNITTEIHTFQYEGETIDVLHIVGAKTENSQDGACELCGFKIRKGNHSYMIQRANGKCGVESHIGQVYLPTNMFINGKDPHQMSLGFFEIGSECRKQLPAKFVTKRSNIVSA